LKCSEKTKEGLSKLVILGRKIWRVYEDRGRVVGVLPRISGLFWDKKLRYPNQNPFPTERIAIRCGLPTKKEISKTSEARLKKDVEKALKEVDWFDEKKMIWRLNIEPLSERIELIIIC